MEEAFEKIKLSKRKFIKAILPYPEVEKNSAQSIQ